MNYALLGKVKKPNRANKHDAGTDLFIPEFNQDWIDEYYKQNKKNRAHVCRHYGKDAIYIDNHETVVIPLRVKINVPVGWVALVKNKSGVSTKYGLTKLAEVIDSGYQGEVFFSVKNTSSEGLYIYEGQKICQIILQEVSLNEWCEVKENELFDTESSRGEGKMGSTGV